MSKILIRGGAVITLDEADPVLPDADVAISDGRIAFVGAAPAGFAPDEIVDATGCLVMPGLCNAHIHSGTVFSRGLSGHDGPEPWFDLSVTRDGQPPVPVPDDPPMTGEDAYWAALLAAAELIRGGVTAFADQYFFMEDVGRAALESGLRANLAWCAFGAEEGEIGGDIADVAEFTERWQGAGGGRIRTSLGPHSAYACSPQFLARTAAVAVRLGAGVRLRAAESDEQVNFSLLAYDMTPVEVLDKNGLLDAPVSLINAARLDEHDLPILAARGASVVACPLAQAAAAVPPTPIARLLEAGVIVGLGTDGAGLSGSLDMFAVAARRGAAWAARRRPRAARCGLARREAAAPWASPRAGVLRPATPQT